MSGHDEPGKVWRYTAVNGVRLAVEAFPDGTAVLSVGRPRREPEEIGLTDDTRRELVDALRRAEG